MQRLEKIAIEICYHSEKSINVSDKSRIRLRHTRNKNSEKEKTLDNREKENDRKNSSSVEKSNDTNKDNKNDAIYECANGNADRISENKKKKSRNN